MAANILIRPACLADARTLAPCLRQADRAEVWAAHRQTPEEALHWSVTHATHAWAGLADGDLVCLWGVCPASLLDREGIPWLLGSDAVKTHARIFLHRSRPLLAEMLRSYRRLTNRVDARNRVSIRWLTWLGFTLFPAAPFGPDGLPFHPFTLATPSPWRQDDHRSQMRLCRD